MKSMLLIVAFALLTFTFVNGQIEPPSDWIPPIANGNMVWTPNLPMPQGSITPGYFPVLGNGYLAKESGPFFQPYVNHWPIRASGGLHVNGVFNGEGFDGRMGPSHRAQLPPYGELLFLPTPGATYTNLGSAIDYQKAVYLNRTAVDDPNGGCSNTVLEQRVYAHRKHKHVLVYDFTAKLWNQSRPWTGCQLMATWGGANPHVALDAALEVTSEDSNVVVWSGATLFAEESRMNTTRLAIAVDKWVSTMSVERASMIWSLLGEFKTGKDFLCTPM